MAEKLQRWMRCTLWLSCCGAAPVEAAVIRVPQDVATISNAISAASNGDTVLIARGTYGGGLVLSGKTLTLASNYVYTSDAADIAQTIIDGGDPILTIQSTVGPLTTVNGLTFRNGGYHLVNHARRVNILNNRFLQGAGDQLSFESAGGLVSNCFFDGASDDGIDSDNASDPTIENNVIQNAGDDGIEIRLQGYVGPMLTILIRNNTISGCGEDGIQLIDYPGLSSRVFRIERNILVNNSDVGLGCMANGNTTENFAGAPLVEEVQVVNNTISGNPYGLTGGDNMLVMNNIVVNASQIGVKRVTTSSLVTYNDFWGNGTNHFDSNVDLGTTWLQDPIHDGNYTLQAGSPCIDVGASSIAWNGKSVHAPSYSGPAPDLGARESGTPVGVPDTEPLQGLEVFQPVPNPTGDGSFSIALVVWAPQVVRTQLFDLSGRAVAAPTSHRFESGPQILRGSLTDHRGETLRTGVYFIRVSTERGHVIRKLVALER